MRTLAGIIRAGLMLGAVTTLAACSGTPDRAPSTTAALVTTTTSSAAAPPTTVALATTVQAVRRVEALFAHGQKETFDATYKQDYGSDRSTVFALQSPAGSAGGSALQEDFFLHKGGYVCGRVALTAPWACSLIGAPNGYSALFVNSFVPRRLGMDLQNTLAQAPSSSVRVGTRALSGRQLRCLVFRERGWGGATWCLTGSGVLAYFTTDGLNLGAGDRLPKETVRLESFSTSVSRQMLVLPSTPAATAPGQ
jgi:hypothetical protein